MIYSDVQADPPDTVVLEAAAFAKQENIDVVLGFGGGSSMDVAKLIAILAHPEQHQTLSDLYGVDNATGPRLAFNSGTNYGWNRFRSDADFDCHHR